MTPLSSKLRVKFGTMFKNSLKKMKFISLHMVHPHWGASNFDS